MIPGGVTGAHTECADTVRGSARAHTEYDDEDEEDEEEYVEEIRIGMKKVDLKAKPELTKYIEVDFRRDENGEVLFDGTLGDAPCPSSPGPFSSDEDGLLFLTKDQRLPHCLVVRKKRPSE